MTEENDFALVPRLPGSLEKAEPGAKRILSGMVADMLALAEASASVKLPFYSSAVLDSWCQKGVNYYEGIGVPQDCTEAAKWFRMAAGQGHSEAQYHLSRCCYNGEGVPKDYAETVKWLRMAADQGYAAAQCDLAFSYDEGLGVPQDCAEAVKWYRKAQILA